MLDGRASLSVRDRDTVQANHCAVEGGQPSATPISLAGSEQRLHQRLIGGTGRGRKLIML